MRAVIFSGQGSQRRGMGGERLFDQFRELVQQADDVLGYSIRRLCLEDPKSELSLTQFTQPAIYTVSALHYFRAAEATCQPPDFVAGFSLGEYNALLCAGAFDFITGLRLVNIRAALMGRSSGGAMAAIVGLAENRVRQVLNRHNSVGTVIANYNAPRQFVISGRKAEIERLQPIFTSEVDLQLYAILKTSGAFHSPLMSEAARRFEEYLNSVSISPFSCKVISNVTGRPYEGVDVKSLLTAQITMPVRWTESVQYMQRAGVADFEEIGESRVLTGLIQATLRDTTFPNTNGPRAMTNHITTTNRNNSATVPDYSVLTIILTKSAQLSDKCLQIYHNEQGVVRITGTSLVQKVRDLGSTLIRLMVPKEKVILILPQNATYSTTLLACWFANLVPIPTPVIDQSQFEQKKPLLDAIIRSSSALYLLTNETLEEPARVLAAEHNLILLSLDALSKQVGRTEQPRATHGNDLAMILYTSGSTSAPKGVMLTHQAIFHTATSKLWSLSAESCVVSWLPQFHAFGLAVAILSPLTHGCLSVLCSPEHFIGNPEIWFRLIRDYKATHTGAPNFALNYCCDHLSDLNADTCRLDSLQALICAGDTISKKSYDRFSERFTSLKFNPDVLKPLYGLSEASPVSSKRAGSPPTYLTIDRKALSNRRVERSATLSDGRCLVSCGEIDANTELRIVDPLTLEICGSNFVGEIWLKGPSLAAGYLDHSDCSRAAFNGIISGEETQGSFFRTGDLGFVVDGQLYVVGREKDLIIVNGKNHYSADIETTLRECGIAATLPSLVLSCEVDDTEKVVVIQEIDSGLNHYDHSTITSEIASIISAKHQLQVYEIMLVTKGSIPLTGNRKVDRRRARLDYLAGTTPFVWKYREGSDVLQTFHGAIPGPTNDLIAQIKNKVLFPEVGNDCTFLADDAPFSRIGLDSITYMRLARRVESEFEVQFKVGLFFKYNNCRLLATYLLSLYGTARSNNGTRLWHDYADPTVLRILDDVLHSRIALEEAITRIRGGIQ